MKRSLPFFLLFLVLTSFSTSSAGAYTATDYYNAGLQLYNAQNYTQASQYFSAAIQMDPNNAAALQGRANCYYAQGQYQQALDDYQKVQALSPNPQLASMIQALQAKLGTGATAAPPPQPGAPAEDPFAQGTALFQQRQYAQAIPLFQKATQDNPKNANAYYYLGACQMQMGDLKDAAVALGVSNRLNPNPSVDNYVNQIKSRLSPDDQQWVDGQITAQATASAAGMSSPATPKSFGVRLEPSIALISPADFTTNAQSLEKSVLQNQSFDPSETYSGVVPQGGPNIAIEPVYEFGKNFEIGLPIAFFPVGTATDAITDSSGSYAFNDSFAISAFSAGLDLRYILRMGDFQPFIAAGGLVEPISIAWTFSQTNSSGTETANGNFSGTAVGGQIQLGLDWHLGDSFALSPYAGFQFASANLFTGNFSATTNSGTQNYTGQLELEPFGANGYAIYADSSNFTPPSGSRPLQLDLSGPFFGIGLSGFF